MFNKIAEEYDEARPKYPDEVINWIIKETDIDLKHKLLEIAPGTGQATLKFAEKGYKIQAVELGDNLGKILEENCKNYDVTVDISSFEDWESEMKYDLIYCATAFHWIDSDVRYKKCFDLLKENSKLVLIWHVASGKMNSIIEKAYEALWRYYPDRKSKVEPDKSLKDRRKDDVNESGYFELENYHEHKWVYNQSKEKFLKGFKTQSSYIYLDSYKKKKLNQELEVILIELEETVDTEFLTTVYICKKKNGGKYNYKNQTNE